MTDALRKASAGSPDLIAYPDRASARLVERAVAEQWDLERDLAWDEMQLAALPAGVRSAMITVYSQIHYGEALALRLAERALDGTPESWARRFCAMQLIDERRHVRFFSRVLGQLGEPGPVSPALVGFAAQLDECVAPHEIALGVQVVLESFAQTVFLEGARWGRDVTSSAIRFPHTMIAARFLTSLADYVGKDESRHVAFGVHYLRGYYATLAPHERRDLEAKVARWVEQLAGTMRQIGSATAVLGIPAARLQHKVDDVLQRHLRRIGLAYQAG